MKLSKQLRDILYSSNGFQSERPRILANYLMILHWKHFVNYVPQIRFLAILISDITRILLQYKNLVLYYINSCTFLLNFYKRNISRNFILSISFLHQLNIKKNVFVICVSLYILHLFQYYNSWHTFHIKTQNTLFSTYSILKLCSEIEK